MDRRITLAALIGGILFAIAAVVVAIAGAAEAEEPVEPEPAPANVLFVMVDDASGHIVEKAMPNVTERIGAAGAIFPNAIAGQPLCCPNRAVIFTGMYPHNTGVLGNDASAPGGFETFRARGHHNATYGASIGAAGRSVSYFGKVMNGYPSRGPGGPQAYNVVFNGFDRWLGGAPMAECLAIDGEKRCPAEYEPQAHDRYITDKAVPAIERWGETPEADFASVMLYNPHSPWEYPERYADLFKGEKPPSEAFNEADVSDKPPFIRARPRLSGDRLDETMREYREKLRSAAYTDDQIGRLLDALERSGQADNTYVVFYTDNGYKTGEHRLEKKNSPYQEDVRFPLMVSGPGIEAGQIRPELINSVDLRPTLDDMAGAAEHTPSTVDGESFLPLALGHEVAWRRFAYSESLLAIKSYAVKEVKERARRLHKRGRHRKARALIGDYHDQALPAWRSVHTESGDYHMWLSGESLGYEEFYSRAADPYQLDGLIDESEEPLVGDYRLAMAAYQECAAETCREAGK